MAFTSETKKELENYISGHLPKEDVLRAGDKLIITEVDNFTSYKNYNIWLIELKRNISGKVICVTRGDTNWKDKSR